MSGPIGNNPYRSSGVVAAAAGGGAVDWCTTAQTSPLTGAAGKGYFINTTSGAITVTLPSSPTAGDIVALKDYAGTWDTNAVTLGRGGSKINGTCLCATLKTEGMSVTMIYVDGTKGWQDVNDSTQNVTGGSFLSATGGTITTCGCYKNHTFDASGTLEFTSLSTCTATDLVSYMVLAGGGGGGAAHGGGGGAGGFREGKDPADPYAPNASPLAAACSALTVTATTYPITVGCGGAGGAPPNGASVQGGSSIFHTITSAGGGGGASAPLSAGAGGSGGGATYINATGGAGDTPDVTPNQGFPGGNAQPSSPYAPGGGGGAAAVGGTGSGSTAGPGGAGVTTSISNAAVQRGGGGGGGHQSYTTSSGGCAGAGGGGAGSQGSGIVGSNGTAYTGGGGGGGHANCPNPGQAGGTGGKGRVIVRYKYQ